MAALAWLGSRNMNSLRPQLTTGLRDCASKVPSMLVDNDPIHGKKLSFGDREDRGHVEGEAAPRKSCVSPSGMWKDIYKAGRTHPLGLAWLSQY